MVQNMNIAPEQFSNHRDIYFEELWTQFINGLKPTQRRYWRSRRKYFEPLGKGMWDAAAATILDLLKQALENRSQLVVAQTLPKQPRGISGRVK